MQQDEALKHAWDSMLTVQKKRSVNADVSQYGYQLFAGTPITFAPATAIPVPPEYVLGPGDELNIHFYGSKDDNIQAVVDREGMIDLPSIGMISLIGQNFQQAKALIAAKIHERMIGVTSSISMGRLRSIRVFVLGDVNNPGSYVVSGLSTISNALFVSGGVSKQGSLRHVILKRAGKKIAELDLYDFLLRGDSSRDVRLLPGDVVFIPPLRKVITVAGVVTRPGIYELKSKGMKVSQAFKLAGGSLASGDVNHVQIDRITSKGGRTLLNLDMSKKSDSLTALKDGDILVVYPVPGIKSRIVHLTGHVKRPGAFGFTDGMRVSDLITSKDALLPYAFLDYMIIQRRDSNTGALTVLRPNLKKVLQKEHSDKNPKLKAYDELLVFSNKVMKDLDSVTVTGAVVNPGTFPLGKGLRLSDLVFAAGGPKENTYMKEVELTRYVVEGGETRVLKHVTLNLSQALSGDETNDILLKAHDVLMVRTIANWGAHEQIELKGEFKFPGVYTIENGETLTEVIERAGGLTEDAYMPAAVFSREAIRESQQKRLSEYANRLEAEISQTQVSIQSIHDPKLLMARESALTKAQTVLEKYRKIKPEGRLLIDLNEKGKLAGGAVLKLADNDMLYIPKRPDQVMVIGEVYNQSAMIYKKYMNRDDFIDLAGGVTSTGDKGRIYIVRANGYIDSGNGWGRSNKVYPGDVIVVPQSLEAFNLLDSTLDWSKALMQIGVFTASMVTVGIL